MIIETYMDYLRPWERVGFQKTNCARKATPMLVSRPLPPSEMRGIYEKTKENRYMA